MIYIGCDHSGLELKSQIIEYLKSVSIKFEDITIIEEHDYTDIAKLLVSKISLSDDIGVLICGSGVGMSIVANRFKNIRASLCHSEQVSKLSRQHNDSNILCLGSRIVPLGEQLKIIDTFLNTPFEGGRHYIRVSKINL